MWKGVKVAYGIIALCLYPIAIGGFWAYGNQVIRLYLIIRTALELFSVTDFARLLCRYLQVAS
jgi:hypothetical protein